MREVKLKATIVFEKNYKEYKSKEHRIIIDEGGTGSSKTVSLVQLFAIIMMSERNVTLTVARKTMPALRATAMKDFFNVLKEMGVYWEEWHNKSEFTYTYMPTGSEVEFVSVDEPIKVRSRRRHYLLLNEANEFSYDDFEQLNMRTERQIFMDYNPSHQFHWIYDKLQTRKDCIVIPSTYKDNPFLAEELVKEIEGYKDKDQNYWRIYGLGLKGIAEALIFTHWQDCDELPESFDKMAYGLDFGFNNPSAIVKVVEKDKDYYWDEVLYKSYLTNTDLIGEMRRKGIKAEDIVYPDMAEPARIEELKRADFNVLESDKDVGAGIDFIKGKRLFVTKRSINLRKELRSYLWKTKDNKVIDEPVKENDHLISAGRYAEYSMSKGKVPIFEWI